MSVSWLAGADLSQRYDRLYPGTLSTPDIGVLHTTEGGGWPDYDGGKVAPNVTAWWTPTGQWLLRQHFPLEMSSASLKNLAGGVQTNRNRVLQIELVGTCDPAAHAAHPSWVFWPQPPAGALAALAALMRRIEGVTGIPRATGPRPWLPYPASYGPSPARMGFAEWNAFRGWTGHQGVPENDHGDPGDLDVAYLIGTAPYTPPGDDMPLSKDDLAAVRALMISKELVELYGNIAADLVWQKLQASFGGAAPLTIITDTRVAGGHTNELLDASAVSVTAALAALAVLTRQNLPVSHDEILALVQQEVRAALTTRTLTAPPAPPPPGE